MRRHGLIAEIDPTQDLAFSYTNLNDDETAEWGYIDIGELLKALMGSYPIEVSI